MGKSSKKVAKQVAAPELEEKIAKKSKREAGDEGERGISTKKRRNDASAPVPQKNVEEQKKKKTEKKKSSRKRPESNDTNSGYDITLDEELLALIKQVQEADPQRRHADEESPENVASRTDLQKENDGRYNTYDEKSDDEEKQASENNLTRSGIEKKLAGAASNQTGPKTLFVGNLPFSVEKSDVLNFFGDAKGVVCARLGYDKDGNPRGFACVEFSSPEAAQSAMKMNGQELNGRALRLSFAVEKGSSNSRTGKGDAPDRKSEGQHHTIFVRGFDRSLAEDEVRGLLQEQFRTCGDIARISIPKESSTGASKGIAYILFEDESGFPKALRKNGSSLRGCRLVVEEARPRSDTKDGGRNSDSSRGGGRFNGRGGGGERDSAAVGRPRRLVAGTMSQAKKTILGDD